jgi:hypothetical protein
MAYEELTLREEQAFRALAAAVARRDRVHALVAAFTEHHHGYEKAVSDLATAVCSYEMAARALLESEFGAEAATWFSLGCGGEAAGRAFVPEETRTTRHFH